jgi:ArsR family transcriptional regulator, arsenate/arsenite/antimonite-responsive transcriptional repressor / arsenate reductase (thioredoxin)
MVNALAPDQPLDFLKLLAHDLRWKLLNTLAWSDHRVQELVQFLNEPMNLVSYHLGRLRSQALVRERRSSADGRDVYYSLDLDRLRQLYFMAGTRLHPALGEPSEAPDRSQTSLPQSWARVLFLCTENSARSQMAEALLHHLSGGRVESFSAGTAPTRVHPLAVATMQRHHLDISRQRAKHLGEFHGQSFAYIITLCDRAREKCPSFPGDPEQIHWSFPDPAAVEGGEVAQSRAFETTAQDLMTRIRYLLLVLEKTAAVPA